MLLLSRRLNESLLIGDDVEVRVVVLDKGQVTLGISAPTRVPVHRREVWEAIRARNVASAETTPRELDRALKACPRGRAAPTNPRDGGQ